MNSCIPSVLCLANDQFSSSNYLFSQLKAAPILWTISASFDSSSCQMRTNFASTSSEVRAKFVKNEFHMETLFLRLSYVTMAGM